MLEIEIMFLRTKSNSGFASKILSQEWQPSIPWITHLFSTSATHHHGFPQDLVSIQKGSAEILSSGIQLSAHQSHSISSTMSDFSLSGTLSLLMTPFSLLLYSFPIQIKFYAPLFQILASYFLNLLLLVPQSEYMGKPSLCPV